MTRHLGDLSDVEIESLHRALVSWLQQVGVAGSIADHYSLYRAIDDEVEKARVRLHTVATDERTA